MTRRAGPHFEFESHVTDEWLAKRPNVAGDIKRRGKLREAASKARHATHRDEGHSYVTGYMGKTDYNVVLDDTRGKLAAMSIEFGALTNVQFADDGSWTATSTTPTYTLTGVPISVGGGDSDV